MGQMLWSNLKKIENPVSIAEVRGRNSDSDSVFPVVSGSIQRNPGNLLEWGVESRNDPSEGHSLLLENIHVKTDSPVNWNYR